MAITEGLNIDLRGIIKAALMTPNADGRWGLNLLLEGDPGTAKTSIIGDVAKEIGLSLVPFIGSIRSPMDVAGWGIPGKDASGRQVIHRAPESTVMRMVDAPAVAFLDEFNNADVATQKALLRFVLEGEAGDYTIHEGVRFIAAQNAVDRVLGAHDLDPALANRFGHLPWPGPSVDEWCDYMLAGGSSKRVEVGDYQAEEDRVMALWPKAHAQAVGLVVAFISRNRASLQAMPDPGDPQASKAWPSARSVEAATRALASAYVHGLDEASRWAFVAAFAGTPWAVELQAFAATADLPDPAQVLDGEVEFTHDPARLDRTAVVLNSCTALVSSRQCPRRDKRAAKLYSILSVIADQAADICIPTLAALSRARLTHCPEAVDVLAKLNPVVLAGMRGR